MAVTSDEFILIVNYLESQGDARITDITPDVRYVNPMVQEIVDLSGTLPTVTFTEVELDATLPLAQAQIAEDETLYEAVLDIEKAKRYLAKQYNDPTPNVVTIYNQIKAYVDANATLTQWVDHEMTTITLVYGVIFTIPPISNAHRVQYIEAVKRVISTFS